MSNGLFLVANLMAACATRPNNAGNRKDGAICTARGGECRYNPKFYSPGLRDKKSWTTPIAMDRLYKLDEKELQE